MGPTVLLALLLAAPPAAETLAPDLVLEVANPRQAGGHQLFPLDDLLAEDPERRVPGLPRPGLLVLFTAEAEDCPPGPGAPGLCAAVADRRTSDAWKGSLVIAVLLVRREDATFVRGRMRLAEVPYPVALDSHGVVRRMLNVNRPGEFLVVDSDRTITRFAPTGPETPASRARRLGSVSALVTRLLARARIGKETP